MYWHKSLNLQIFELYFATSNQFSCKEVYFLHSVRRSIFHDDWKITCVNSVSYKLARLQLLSETFLLCSEWREGKINPEFSSEPFDQSYDSAFVQQLPDISISLVSNYQQQAKNSDLCCSKYSVFSDHSSSKLSLDTPNTPEIYYKTMIAFMSILLVSFV